jgi:hypothetical protein
MDTYSTIPSPPTLPESRKSNKVGFGFALVTIICTTLGAFALLTKWDIIPNYFGIEILQPEKDTSN